MKPLIISNLLFGTQLLEGMTRAGISNLINTGTSWQHYKNEAFNPVNLYSATKQAFEDIIRYYIETSALKVIILKLFDTYGPGDPRFKLLNLMRSSVLRNETLEMSEGHQKTDLVYIHDVVDALITAGIQVRGLDGGAHEIYMVRSSKPVTLRELASLVCSVSGVDLGLFRFGERTYRSREVMAPCAIGADLPGWVPKYSLEEGLRLVFDVGNLA